MPFTNWLGINLRGVEWSIENDATGKISPESKNLGFNKRVLESQARYKMIRLEVSNFDNLDVRVSKIVPHIEQYIHGSKFNKQEKLV